MDAIKVLVRDHNIRTDLLSVSDLSTLVGHSIEGGVNNHMVENQLYKLVRTQQLLHFFESCFNFHTKKYFLNYTHKHTTRTFFIFIFIFLSAA